MNMATPLSEIQIGDLNWRKAMRSVNAGACAEIASTSGAVVVRDSKDPFGISIKYPAASWRSFLSATRTGGFDGIR
jgi:hypothetical protein